MRTLFLRLFSENGPSLLCPVIIRATYRSTEQFVGQGNSVIEPLFNQKTEKSSLCRFFHLILLTLNGQIWLFFGFLSNRLVLFLEDKLIVLLLEDPSFFFPGEKKALTQFSLNSTPLIRTLVVSFQSFFKKTIGSHCLDLQKQIFRLLSTWFAF